MNLEQVFNPALIDNPSCAGRSDSSELEVMKIPKQPSKMPDSILLASLQQREHENKVTYCEYALLL
jgi:hypothetical protein